MPKHKYRTQREYQAQKQQHFEERRRALRERLEREFAEMGVAVKDLSKFDKSMLYRFALIDKNWWELKLSWLEQDFICCGASIVDQDVYLAKKKMGLANV